MYGCLYLYFSRTNSSYNLIISDANSGGNQQFYFGISLRSRRYTLVATTYISNVTGSFSINVTGRESVQFQ